MVGSTTLGVAYVVAALLPLLVVPTALRNRDKPGATGLMWVVTGGVVWSIGSAIGVVGSTDLYGFVSINTTVLAASLMAAGYFLAATEYTGYLTPSPTVLGLVAVEPVLTQVLAWTNPSHHLLYRAGADFGSFATISDSFVAYFWVHTIVAYGLVGLGFFLMVLESVSSSGIRRKQSLALVAAGIPPGITATYFNFVGGVGFNPTPFGVVLTVLILSWALLKAQFLDLVPIAREQAMDEMDDIVVTMDDEGRIVDCNTAAREFVGAGPDYVGMDGVEFFGDFPEMIAQYGNVESADTEATVSKNGQEYHFDVHISPIRDEDDEPAGRIFVLRDVTEQKAQEQQLREREQRLDLTRQVLTRVLRHNIRNDLQVIKMNSEIIAHQATGLDRETELVMSTADELMETSEKARDIDHVLEQEQTVRPLDVAETLRATVDTARSRFSAVSFSLDCPDTCEIHAIPSLELVIENLVENAAEHNTAATPTVECTLRTVEDSIVVTVVDNGPGIPDQELTALRAGQETALEHGSGVGLWLIDWVIDNSNASIDYETDESGTQVTVTIPRQ